MKKGLIIALAAVGAVVLVVGIAFSWVMGARNQFVTLQQDVNKQWSQVENQLQRRNDLIPNLVSTVKGYATHEKGVFDDIAAARAKMAGAKSPAETMDGANQMSGALSRLLLVVENYPNLKADQSFNRLMDELAGTENRLAVERKRYNDVIRDYNVLLMKFPTNLVAGMFNFKEMPYFKAPEEAKAVPKVDFNK
jgi:LemA protein